MSRSALYPGVAGAPSAERLDRMPRINAASAINVGADLSLPAVSPLPRGAIRAGRHTMGTGWATVIHRGSGVVLGHVVRWPDGAWIVYLPYVAERCDEAGTREGAIACLLHAGIHEPPGFERRDGSDRYLRDAAEVEARRLAPERGGALGQGRTSLRGAAMKAPQFSFARALTAARVNS